MGANDLYRSCTAVSQISNFTVLSSSWTVCVKNAAAIERKQKIKKLSWARKKKREISCADDDQVKETLFWSQMFQFDGWLTLRWNLAKKMRLVALTNSAAVLRYFELSMTIYGRFTETHFCPLPPRNEQNTLTSNWFPNKNIMRDSSFEPKLHARPDGLILLSCPTAVWWFFASNCRSRQ